MSMEKHSDTLILGNRVVVTGGRTKPPGTKGELRDVDQGTDRAQVQWDADPSFPAGELGWIPLEDISKDA